MKCSLIKNFTLTQKNLFELCILFSLFNSSFQHSIHNFIWNLWWSVSGFLPRVNFNLFPLLSNLISVPFFLKFEKNSQGRYFYIGEGRTDFGKMSGLFGGYIFLRRALYHWTISRGFKNMRLFLFVQIHCTLEEPPIRRSLLGKLI